MKVKQRADDFRVEELTDLIPGPAGDFAFYRLDKVGWTTSDAVKAVCRRWDLDWRRVSYGGLKDRYADTTQHLTVFRGPMRGLTEHGFRLTHLGQLPEPFASQHITANRFRVVLRDFAPDADAALLAAVAEVERAGLPNYFDDQRFGSVGRDGAFVARELVFGRFEDALRLALTGEYDHDRPADKREKENLRQRWGDWPACRAASRPGGDARRVVEHLAHHPTDLRGAVTRLRPESQGFYLSVYQSELWNRVLDRWLRATLPADTLGVVRLQLGDRAAPRRVPDELVRRWESLTLPLPSARQKAEPGAEWDRVTGEVLAEEGLTLPRLKVPGMHKPFFSKGDRAGCARPAGVRADPAADDRHPGRRKLTLAFDLPRGSYATMFVKRVTAPARPTSSAPETPRR